MTMEEESDRRAHRVDHESQPTRFSPTQLAIAGLGGALVLIIVIVVIGVVSRLP